MYLSDKSEFDRLSAMAEPYASWDNELLWDGKNDRYNIHYIGGGWHCSHWFMSYVLYLMDISEDDHFYLYDLDYRGGERGLIFTENDVYPIFKFERPILRNFFDFHRDGLSSRSLAPEGVPYKYSPSSTSECIIFPKSMEWYVYNERYYADLVKIFTKDDDRYRYVRTLIGVDARDYKEVARIFEAVREVKAEEALK